MLLTLILLSCGKEAPRPTKTNRVVEFNARVQQQPRKLPVQEPIASKFNPAAQEPASVPIPTPKVSSDLPEENNAQANPNTEGNVQAINLFSHMLVQSVVTQLNLKKADGISVVYEDPITITVNKRIRNVGAIESRYPFLKIDNQNSSSEISFVMTNENIERAAATLFSDHLASIVGKRSNFGRLKKAELKTFFIVNLTIENQNWKLANKDESSYKAVLLSFSNFGKDYIKELKHGETFYIGDSFINPEIVGLPAPPEENLLRIILPLPEMEK